MYLLILKACIENDIPVYHLHSIMYLLIQKRYNINRGAEQIYIP